MTLRPLITLAGLVLAASATQAQEFIPLRVAVHVDTSVSHDFRTIKVAGIPIAKQRGELPQGVERIAQIARQQNLDALILADRARAEVSYGLTPFSRLFRVTAAEGSIASYGSARYLQRVRDAEAAYGIAIIPGAECIPYYRWRGNPVAGLRLSHLYEHLVVAGLNTPEALDNIPDTASGYGYRLSWTVLFNLVFVGLLAGGIRMWRRRRTRGRRLAGAVIAVSLLAMIDSAPFLPRKISAYDEPALPPADVLCEYARRHGALVFWAHPSANPGSLPHRLKKTTGITVEVKPYCDRLYQTSDYTGFAMFNAGIAAGEPGGAWDTALEQYCSGERERPVWVVSECDFDAHSPPDGLSDAQTVVWARNRSKDAILEALRHGRCYATLTRTHRSLWVSRYELNDGKARAISGGALKTSAAVVSLELRLGATAPGKAAERLRIKVVADGRPSVLRVDLESDGRTLRATCTVRLDPAKKLSYVRALVCDNDEPILALNPIFVARTGRN